MLIRDARVLVETSKGVILEVVTEASVDHNGVVSVKGMSQIVFTIGNLHFEKEGIKFKRPNTPWVLLIEKSNQQYSAAEHTLRYIASK
jgi:hypothetical protein